MASAKTGRARRRTLVWTNRALRDLKAIDDYIAADDPVAAARCVDKLMSAAQRAVRFPESGHVVREKNRPDLRQIIVRRYRIVYRIRDKQVDVLTVFEGHQLLPPDVK